LALQEYNLDIECIPGKLNIIADTLTRYPRISDGREEKRISINVIKDLTYSKDLCNKLKKISELQKADQYTEKLRKNTIFTTIKNGVVFSRNKGTEQWKVIIPEELQNQVIQETHNTMGHPGRFKIYHIINNTCIFKNMNKKVANIIKTCDECQKNKPINFKATGNIMAHKPTK